MRSILLVNYVQEILDIHSNIRQVTATKSKSQNKTRQSTVNKTRNPAGLGGTGSRQTQKALKEKQQKPTGGQWML